MEERTLFPLPEPQDSAPSPPPGPRDVRVVRPVREQIQLRPSSLEELVPLDHPARAIWQVLETLDLAAFYEPIKALLDRPGRPATDPEVLLALWLLATVEGVGSARRLARLCEEHDAYRWIRGGVPVNYHTLSDFRVAHQAGLDDLLTQIVASLMAAKVVKLERVAQDGMRVRASAGASSFRKKATLKACLREARAQVARLATEREHPDPGINQRERVARERAAREREQRVQQALAYLPRVQAAKERQETNLNTQRQGRVTEPRTSTTDPEARVMKMPDGGFRPAYNVELATDAGSGIIVGVGVTPEGTDAAQAPPMEDQIVQRSGQHPHAYLIDGGFAAREAITTLEQRGVTVYAPVRLPRTKPEAARYEPREGDSAEVIRWRQRMSTREARQTYRLRGATAEWTNAQVRYHGVSQFTVRGLAKVTTVMLLTAVTHNLLRWPTLMG